MALTAAQLTQLKSELQTDPRAYGYAALLTLGAADALALVLNHIRDGSTAAPYGATGAAVTVSRNDIRAAEILDAIDVTEFVTTPSTIQASWFESVTQNPTTLRFQTGAGLTATVVLTATRTLTNLLSLFVNNAVSRTRLTALGNRNGSRAEELFGAGFRVSGNDVSQALAS